MLKNSLLNTIYIILMLLVSQLSYASGYDFGAGSVTASVVKADNDSGVNFDARRLILIFNAAFSLTNVNNNSIANVYAGIGYPFSFVKDDYDSSFVYPYVNIGTGSEGTVYKYGFQMILRGLFDKKIPLGFTLAQETYNDDSEFDNLQLGITYYFD